MILPVPLDRTQISGASRERQGRHTLQCDCFRFRWAAIPGRWKYTCFSHRSPAALALGPYWGNPGDAKVPGGLDDGDRKREVPQA